jgi:hypothetical protein
VAKTRNYPIRLLGVSVLYPPSLALKMRSLDPFFFQGGDPENSNFTYFSFLKTPSNNLRWGTARDTYECEILISWRYPSGFPGEELPIEVPDGNAERVRVMKRLADGWAEPFRECFTSIPEEGTVVKALEMEDYVPKKGIWDNECGRMTLLGDAAHAMTTCMLPTVFLDFAFWQQE